MVALTLGLLLLAGLSVLFVSTNRSYRQNELIAGMQDQARFALATLTRDLAMAGHWGGQLGTSNILPNLTDTDTGNDSSSATTGLGTANDCGAPGAAWAFHLFTRAEFRNQDSGTDIDDLWQCLGHVREGTDIVAIRRVAGQATGRLAEGESSVTLRPYHFYLQTNSTIGTLMRWGANATDTPAASDQPTLAPMTMYRYYPRIYFVRDFSRTPGDGIPALCRKELCPTGYTANVDPELATCGAAGAAPTSAGFVTECVAEGVEDLQIVWGLDSSTDSDDVVERYTSTPNEIEMATQARVAEVSLLVRSRKGDATYVDDRSYRLADKAAFEPAAVSDPAGTPNDQRTTAFYRRAYSATVQMRNPLD
ncbi:MAG TPA: PilW family protein [Nevskiaceae bacterium]|nr:PilW family protein [Nevskiaceae bacterium]